MSVDTFGVSPAGNGDLSFLQIKGAGVPVLSNTTASIGGVGTKPNLYFAAMFRFDLTGVPSGATVNGVRINWTSAGSAGSSMTFDVGFCDRDGIWDAAGAFANYSASSDLPMAEWNNGISADATVWVGDAPGFSISHTTGGALGASLSFGENLAADTSVVGLVAQLQSYLDGEGYAPPVMIQALRAYTSGNQIHQSVVASDHATASYRPTLTVDWTPPVFQGSAEISATASVTSTLKTSPSISAGTNAGNVAAASLGASATLNAEIRGSQT